MGNYVNSKRDFRDYQDYDWDEIIKDEVDLQDKSIWNEKDKSKQKDIVKIINSSSWKEYRLYKSFWQSKKF